MYGSQGVPRDPSSSLPPESQQQQLQSTLSPATAAATAALAAATTTTLPPPSSAFPAAPDQGQPAPVTVLQRADVAGHCHIAAVSTLYPRVDPRSASELNHTVSSPPGPEPELRHHRQAMIPGTNPQDFISLTTGHSFVLSQAAGGSPSPAVVDLIDNSGHDPEKVIEVSPNGRYAKLNTVLGKGAYKVVYKAIDREEGFEVAWNCFQTTKQEFNDLSQEIEILKRVRHPNIINFHDCWYHNMEFVFITELMTSGTLREYIRKLELPNMKIIKRWSRQILRGLTYLHSHDPPIIHRDLKCDNIFINGAHGEVKIGDMGTAKMKLGKKYTVIGTPEFMAPEMYEEKGYNEKADMYAFGMCLLEMVTGEYPYNECKNAAQIYKKVTQGIKPDCLGKVKDPDVFNVICSCIAPEHERPSAQEVADHPFLAVEPEVVLLTVSEDRNHLRLQVVFKGMDKLSVKFEFNVDADTAEEVVTEMIEEEVLPQQFQQLITLEINRILRDLAKTEEKEAMKEEAQQQQHTGWTSRTAQTMTNMQSELDRAKVELAAAQERVLRAEQKAEGAEFRAQQAEERARAAKGDGSISDGTCRDDLAPLSMTARDDPRGPQQTLSAGGAASYGPSANPSSSRATSPVPRHRFPPVALNMPVNRTESPGSVPGANAVDRQQPRSPVELYSSSPIDGLETVIPSRSFGTNVSLTRKNSQAEWTQELENALPHKEYSDDRPIEELIRDTALATNRGMEKAAEWLSRLNDQDIMTVGDLRDLHDGDWASLGLTVFASRALRNALKGRPASGRTGSGPGPGGSGPGISGAAAVTNGLQIS